MARRPRMAAAPATHGEVLPKDREDMEDSEFISAMNSEARAAFMASLSEAVTTKQRGDRAKLSAMMADDEEDPDGSLADLVNTTVSDFEGVFGEAPQTKAFDAFGLDTAYDLPPEIDNADPAREARIYLEACGRDYAEEHILRAVHRMSIRGVPISRIARTFNVTLSTATRWRDTLRERMRREVEFMDTGEMVGEILATYNDIGQEAMREASSVEAVRIEYQIGPDNTRRQVRVLDKAAAAYKARMLGVAMAAHGRRAGVLDSVGVYDSVRRQLAHAEATKATDEADLNHTLRQIMSPRIDADSLTLLTDANRGAGLDAFIQHAT